MRASSPRDMVDHPNAGVSSGLLSRYCLWQWVSWLALLLSLSPLRSREMIRNTLSQLVKSFYPILGAIQYHRILFPTRITNKPTQPEKRAAENQSIQDSEAAGKN
jgi:hypothetical protein